MPSSGPWTFFASILSDEFTRVFASNRLHTEMGHTQGLTGFLSMIPILGSPSRSLSAGLFTMIHLDPCTNPREALVDSIYLRN